MSTEWKELYKGEFKQNLFPSLRLIPLGEGQQMYQPADYKKKMLNAGVCIKRLKMFFFFFFLFCSADSSGTGFPDVSRTQYYELRVLGCKRILFVDERPAQQRFKTGGVGVLFLSSPS